MKPYKVSPEQLTGIYEAIKKREGIPDQHEILGEANRRAAEMYKKTPPGDPVSRQQKGTKILSKGSSSETN